MPAVNAAFPFGSGSSAMYLAMRPTERFAQKRADRNMALQVGLQTAQLAQQEFAVYENNRRELQKTMDYVEKMPLLPRGVQLIRSQVIDPIRNEIKEKIKTQYNGSERDFLQREGSYYQDLVSSKLMSDPLVEKQLRTKTNVALALKDLQDGKVLKGGNTFNQALSDYNAGVSDFIDYGGSYNPPKGILDVPLKNTHPDVNFKYGVFDQKTGRYNPVKFTREDFIQQAMNNGMQAKEVADWLTYHQPYNGEMTWKQDERFTPYQEQQLENTKWNQGFQERKFNADQRQRAITNSLQRESLNIRKAALNKADAIANGTMGIPTSEFLFNPMTGGAREVVKGGASIIERDLVPDDNMKNALVDRTGIIQEYDPSTKTSYYKLPSGNMRFFNEGNGVWQKGNLSGTEANVDKNKIYLLEKPTKGSASQLGGYKVKDASGATVEMIPAIRATWNWNNGDVATPAAGYVPIPVDRNLVDYLNKRYSINSTKGQIGTSGALKVATEAESIYNYSFD